MPKFKIIKKDETSKARAGELITDHGIVETPAFVPVGTQGTVKALSPRDLKEIGVPIVLANTYHLHLRPGEKAIQKLDGLAKWMGWNSPTMTDSGGFQVFSLGVGLEKPGVKFLKEGDGRKWKVEGSTSKMENGRSIHSQSSTLKNLSSTIYPLLSEEPRPRLNKITEEGVEFQSHIDGSKHKLTPESSIEIQEKLGADLIVGFDDLESPAFDFNATKKSLELTNRWLLRSLKAHKRSDQLLYGVTHGGKFEDLRVESAEFADKNFDAIALGGAHYSKKNMYDVVDWTIANVDENKPRHQLGVGEIDDIFEIIERGVDTFDCVIPTRLGRMGHVFVYPPEGNRRNRFRFDIAKSRLATSNQPLAISCSCFVCQNFTLGYINHLFRSRELLAYNLLTYHNVYFVTNLVSQIRESILGDSFSKLKSKWL